MRSIAMLGLVLLLISGCDSHQISDPVGGVVYFRGQPLAGGLIVFTPDPDKGNSGPSSYGIIQPDGRFTLTTEDKKGAIRGWHRVTVAPPVDEKSALLYRDFPERFRNPAESGLKWEVKADDKFDVFIELLP